MSAKSKEMAESRQWIENMREILMGLKYLSTLSKTYGFGSSEKIIKIAIRDISLWASNNPPEMFKECSLIDLMLTDSDFDAALDFLMRFSEISCKELRKKITNTLDTKAEDVIQKRSAVCH